MAVFGQEHRVYGLLEQPWSIDVRYLTLKQVSEKLGNRSRTSIYRDVNLGRLPKPMKFGGRVYFDEAEVEATVEAQHSHHRATAVKQ